MIAGYTPKTSPTSTDTENARTTEPGVMIVDQPAKLAMTRERSAPRSRRGLPPISPPVSIYSIVR